MQVHTRRAPLRACQCTSTCHVMRARMTQIQENIRDFRVGEV